MTSKIDDIFLLDRARSRGVGDYQNGTIPFVTSTELNNGVIAYVEPEPEDKVFIGPAITISGLGHATFQRGAFLPKGNGGDSHTILKPKKRMTTEEIFIYTALFNMLHKWRFSYGRKCSLSRIKELALPAEVPKFENIWVEESAKVEMLIQELSDFFRE